MKLAAVQSIASWAVQCNNYTPAMAVFPLVSYVLCFLSILSVWNLWSCLHKTVLPIVRMFGLITQKGSNKKLEAGPISSWIKDWFYQKGRKGAEFLSTFVAFYFSLMNELKRVFTDFDSEMNTKLV